MSSPTQNVLGRLPIVPNGTLHRVPATPRKRKTPVPDRLHLGVKQLAEKLQDIKSKVRQRLSLEFDLDDWQGELTLKALERDQVIEVEKWSMKIPSVPSCGKIFVRDEPIFTTYPRRWHYPPASFICGQDQSFRNRVQALVIDEAHCIVEWGDDFRKEYAALPNCATI
ncbi:hypothetical protein B0H14DRAFT_2560411 [Mycena olivaceomarginata]|nr:hypothetical protein B0H14DRAFT_2560411 [Mycena olivaceomarginata]